MSYPSARSGPYGGLNPPIPIAGMGLWPYGMIGPGSTKAISANRAYIAPFPVFRTQAFAGFQFADSGAGNNGQNIRAGVYAEASTGGPGTLLKDFGAAGLTAVAGTHQIANAVTLQGPQMCYLLLVGDSASVLKCMSGLVTVTGVGLEVPQPQSTLLGMLSSSLNEQSQTIGWFAAQAYGALPATAPTPTATLVDTISGATGALPGMQLYV